MSRSAADATRFTATGPYVSSKTATPSAIPYRLPPGSKLSKPAASSGSNQQQEETPRQKVERLRAQARAARLAQSTSRVDRMIEIGRNVANKAHKAMIYTLIAASGVCGALTLYSIVSLTLYNRRQRALWLDRQLEQLQQARLAYTNGTATPEQLEILRNEKIGEIEKQKREEERQKRWYNRAKRYLFEGLKKEDTPDGTTATATTEDAAAAKEGNKVGVLDALNAKKAEEATTINNTNTSASASTSTSTTTAGSLDRLAENAETAAKQSARSWTSWIWGR
ncbi:hypothetical protein VTN96DRAFT_5453 [Rasamsonia emersonii]|uniref:Cytochrome oxidase c assembly-domain-containing protein n=1 Tax=Rasamsonia emersonii (strain ATCC 16479 / CBS 393.64 / IMI 116815) TaxID=1408163 RepID=A0A0F4YSN9_RASE3|nr:hypothetical protein T310_4755 [Rasamsonia emersonii CBS 393.64]KKA21249.1 hypothetical protein T310_4755 [Rasamsonia emersonii CBS 393.64]